MYCITQSLHRNKRFMHDEMSQRNSLKFAIFYIYENPKLSTQTRAFIREKIKQHEMKNEKKYTSFRIPKIWQILKHISLDHFIKHKPLISLGCFINKNSTCIFISAIFSQRGIYYASIDERSLQCRFLYYVALTYNLKHRCEIQD